MLRNGSRGDDVVALQKSLLSKGIDPGPADGAFGPKTEAALKRFQEKAGLDADGICGPKTRAALDEPGMPGMSTAAAAAATGDGGGDAPASADERPESGPSADMR